MNKAYLGLGSNLNNPSQQINLAIELISKLKNSQLVARSTLYHSKALIPPERPDEIQPDYVNAVVALDTKLTPFELLKECQQIENLMGRVRSDKRWEARIIDVDLLLFNNLSLSTDELTLPHPEIKNRLFVLNPLLEIAPELVLL